MLARLERFKNAISAKSVESNSEAGGGYDEDLSDWTGVKLKFATESRKVSFALFFGDNWISLTTEQGYNKTRGADSSPHNLWKNS